MTTFFEVSMLLIGVVIVVLLWAIFVRLADLHNLERADAQAFFESLQHELTILWCAITADPEHLAEQRKIFGYGPLFSWHEELARYTPWQRKKYQQLKEHLDKLESTYWPLEERAKKAIEIEEARLELRMSDASATLEERERWEKIQDAKLEAEVAKREKKGEKQ
jgi:hypothetical protein